MPNMQVRGAASKALKAFGPTAEDAVLVHLKSKDDWTRAETCEVLKVIGTAKSLPALETASNDSNWMVKGAANAALSAVKLRNQLKTNTN
jgi:HEAT repeat protein